MFAANHPDRVALSPMGALALTNQTRSPARRPAGLAVLALVSWMACHDTQTGQEPDLTPSPDMGGAPPVGEVCLDSGWCWANPSPHGFDYWALWVGSATDVWAVDETGAATHYDGQRLTRFPGISRTDLRAVWGSGPRDVWAAGDAGSIVHYDGTSWRTLPSGVTTDFRAVWGSGPMDVWIVGGKTILRYDGTSLTNVDTGLFQSSVGSIWGSGPRDVWITNSSSMLHYDGASWSSIKNVTNGSQISMWGSGPRDIYSAGVQLIHYDGTSWQPVNDPAVTNIVAQGIWGSATNDVWMVTGGGLVLHYDGSKWSQQDVPAAKVHPYLKGVSGTSPNNVWAAGVGGALLRKDQNGWTSLTQGPGETLSGLWSSGADDIWAVGRSTVWHRGGMGWELVKVPTNCVRDVWGSGKSDIFLVGCQGLVLHYDGAAWTRMTLPSSSDLNSVYGTSPNDVWTVGNNGADGKQSGILHYDGKAWKAMFDTADIHFTATRVWASRADDVWFTFLNGSGGRYDGRALSPTGIPGGPQIHDIRGSASNNVWAAGLNVIWRYDGSKWNSVTPPRPPTSEYYRVWPRGVADAWVTVHEGVAHFDGASWTEMHIAYAITSECAFAESNGQLWLSGDYGALLYRR